jgi:plasmid stability protein
MRIELPEELAAALKVKANARGISADAYAREVLERDLASSVQAEAPGAPFKTGRGILAKYGPAPSAEEIEANRADMFRGFGEDF